METLGNSSILNANAKPACTKRINRNDLHIYTSISCKFVQQTNRTQPISAFYKFLFSRKYLVQQLLLIHTGIFASLIGFQPLHGHRVLGTSSALFLGLIVLPAFLRYSRYRGRYSPGPRPNKFFWAVISRGQVSSIPMSLLATQGPHFKMG